MDNIKTETKIKLQFHGLDQTTNYFYETKLMQCEISIKMLTMENNTNKIKFLSKIYKLPPNLDVNFLFTIYTFTTCSVSDITPLVLKKMWRKMINSA